jgi:hypothetical protein
MYVQLGEYSRNSAAPIWWFDLPYSCEFLRGVCGLMLPSHQGFWTAESDRSFFWYCNRVSLFRNFIRMDGNFGTSSCILPTFLNLMHRFPVAAYFKS